MPVRPETSSSVNTFWLDRMVTELMIGSVREEVIVTCASYAEDEIPSNSASVLVGHYFRASGND